MSLGGEIHGVAHAGPFAPATASSPVASIGRTVMKVQRVTPLLYVEEIEPVLPFWERLEFERTAEVNEGDRLGFVLLARDGCELMYQTRASVQNDVPALAESPRNASFLFIVVDDLDHVERVLATEPVVPRRTTFYGADEIVVRDPAGNVVTFAQFGDATPA
jgi:hypothetical protein